MCGLAGVVRRAIGAREQAATMARLLTHRGPDGHGSASWPDAKAARTTIIHHRLAVLDPSPAGAQPLTVDNGEHWLIYNGEVYNHQHLARQLGLPESRCDTKTVARMLLQLGIDALPRLSGMFALAWLDSVRGELLLARDPLGIKPLYWCELPDGLAFASEIKALRSLGVARTADPQGLWDHVRHGLTDHRDATCFAGIRQLPAGGWIRIDLHRAQIAAHGRFSPAIRRGDETQGDLSTAFRDTIAGHLVADVPVGFALSGGLDSSAILCTAARLSGSRLHAIGFASDEPDSDEQTWMRIAAESAGAQLHTVRASAEDMERDFDDLILTQDEPFGGPSIYAQYCVFRSARELGLTVMLDGQGADELLGGYAPALAARAGDLLLQDQAWRLPAYLLSVCAGRPGSARRVLRGMLSRLLWGRIPPLRSRLGPSWLRRPWFRDRRVDPFLPPPRRSSAALGDLLDIQVASQSLPQLLRFEDRNSMRFSIESRVPFCDPELARTLAALSVETLISGTGESKAPLRAAMKGIVPETILRRRDKIGFAAPDLRWLHGRLPDRILAESDPARTPWCDLPRLAAEVAQVRRGGALQPALWRSLIALRWATLHNLCP